MSRVHRLLGLAAPLRVWLGLAALASFAALAANVALMTAAPYLISKAALVTGFADIALAVTAVRAFAIARAALRYAERYATHLAALRILTHLRVWLYRAVEPLSPGATGGRRSGDLLARAVADVDTLDGFFVRGLVPPVAAALAAAVACVVLGALDGRLGLLLLLLLVLSGIGLPLAVGRGSRRPAARLVAARGELYATLAEDVHGLADLMACGRERALGEHLRRRSGEMGRARRGLASVRGASAAASALLVGLAGIALLALAIPLVRAGLIEGVLLAVVPLVAFAAFEGVQSLTDALRHAELGIAAAARTFDLIDAAPAVVDPPQPLPLGPLPSLELRRVRFAYVPGGPSALDGVDLWLPPGGRLAVTGPSGAGKTTLVGLLLRFWEIQAGAILLDGRDVRRHRAEDVRRLVGVVPQRIHLFNGTLRDNLLLADGEARDDRILDACERAVLGELLRSLPHGLDTPVGENGLKLSGGERQRVALARVFLRGAPILVLDEATANLDAVTERRVLRSVDAFAAGRSVLVISHRPAALELAGRAIALPPPAGSRRPAPTRAAPRPRTQPPRRR